MTTRKSAPKNIVPGCVARSERHIDIPNAKSVGKEHLIFSSLRHLSKRLYSFWDSVKKFKRSHRRQERNQEFSGQGRFLGTRVLQLKNREKLKRKRLNKGKILSFFS